MIVVNEQGQLEEEPDNFCNLCSVWLRLEAHHVYLEPFDWLLLLKGGIQETIGHNYRLEGSWRDHLRSFNGDWLRLL